MSKLAPPPGVGEAAVQEVQWGQQLEESQLHWALGETSLALQTLRDTTQRLEKVSSVRPLYKGHLSNEDTVCSPNHTELCTNLPLNWGHFSIQDNQLRPNGVHYTEVPLYTGQPAGSQWCPL